jgi:hypothetical protein
VAPTVFKTRNLRVVIFPKDHRPAHVHVYGPDGEAKFDIHTLECLSNKGFSERLIKRIQAYLSERQPRLLEVWDEYQE